MSLLIQHSTVAGLLHRKPPGTPHIQANAHQGRSHKVCHQPLECWENNWRGGRAVFPRAICNSLPSLQDTEGKGGFPFSAFPQQEASPERGILGETKAAASATDSLGDHGQEPLSTSASLSVCGNHTPTFFSLQYNYFLRFT